MYQFMILEFPPHTCKGEMKSELCSCTRSRVIEFLIQSTQELEVSPMIKYSALSLFADRFYPSLSRMGENKGIRHWLLDAMTESNLQLFALISLWISSKIHDSPPLSVKKLKSLGDKYVREQHFTTRDLLEAEVVFMQVLDFGIGTSNTAFVFLDEILNQFKAVACAGKYVDFDICMDIMDLLYEEEEALVLYRNPRALAASILVAAYLITVPIQKWEFPILPWVKFVISSKEDVIIEAVTRILKHVLKPQGRTPKRRKRNSTLNTLG